MADRALSCFDSDLASRVELIPSLDARLVLISPEENVDRYHVLQGLVDTSAGDDPKCCYSYQHWGNTGDRSGQFKVSGPMEQAAAAEILAKAFKEKTGKDWGQMGPGDRAEPGKFWVQRHAQSDAKARWQYYVSDGVDGKATGWYDYEPEASEEVEEIYAQHVANQLERRTEERVVHSSYFSYRVNLAKLTQANTRTGKVRQIRRTFEAAAPVLPRKAAKVKAKARLAAMKRPMKEKGMKAAKAMKMKKAKTPMKATKKAKKARPMKAMKKTAAKKASKIARGTRRYSQVLLGKKERTPAGLTKADLMRNREGRIVSRKRSAVGKRSFGNIEGWVGCCKRARVELGLAGFVAVRRDSELYKRAAELYRGPATGMAEASAGA